MRLLLDENVTRKLAPLLIGHEALTVRRMGWAGRSNGDLLQAMLNEDIHVIITMDRNLRHQLPIERYGVHIVVLVAKSNGIEHIMHLVDPLLSYLETRDLALVKEIE